MKIYTIEVTNNCNADCEYCPHGKMKREKGYMSMETFEKILRKQKNDFIEFSGFGEPLMHPDIFKMIRMSHEKGLRTILCTNGKLINRDIMIKLCDSGLDLIIISIRHFFDDVITNMKDIYDNFSTRMKIVFYYVEYPEFRRELPFFSKNWNIQYTVPHTWSSNINTPFIKRNEKCFNLKNNSVSVLWDGRISNCCHDIDGQYILGTIDDKELEPGFSDLCKRCEFNGKI